MGFNISWLAFMDMQADDVCEAIRAERTGQYDEPFSHDLMGAEMPNGAYLVLVNGRGQHDGLAQIYPEKTSLENEIVSCVRSDTAGITILNSHAKGRQRWSIMRMPDELDDLWIEGEVPEAFAAIRARREAEQAEADDAGEPVDYLGEAPIDLGQDLTGFHHELVQPDIRFEVLSKHVAMRSKYATAAPTSAPNFPSPRPWWKFW